MLTAFVGLNGLMGLYPAADPTRAAADPSPPDAIAPRHHRACALAAVARAQEPPAAIARAQEPPEPDAAGRPPPPSRYAVGPLLPPPPPPKPSPPPATASPVPPPPSYEQTVGVGGGRREEDDDEGAGAVIRAHLLSDFKAAVRAGKVLVSDPSSGRSPLASSSDSIANFG
jgi:hypothetical protein